VAVELAAALGLAEMEPVGRTIRGAAEAVALDEGFQEDGSIGIVAVQSTGSCRAARARTLEAR